MLRRDLDRLEWLSKLRRKTVIIQEVKSENSNQPAGNSPNAPITTATQGLYTQAIINEVSNLSPNLDAFERLRISNPITIFDCQQNYASEERDLLWCNVTNDGTSAFSYNGTGGLLANVNERASVLLNLDGTGRVYRQTKQYFRYQSSKSQLIYMTFLMDDSKMPYIYQRAGYFDDYNGIYLQKSTQPINEWGNYSDSTYAFVVRSTVPGQLAVSDAVTDVFAQQPNWNLDTLDGSGDINNPSKIKLDLDKIQTLAIELGGIENNRIKIGFVMNGKTIWCHQFLYGNTESNPFIGTAHLPLRYELEVSGSDVPYLECFGAVVISEGGYEESHSYPFSYITDIAVAAVGGKATNTNEPLGINTTRESLFALRPNITNSGALPIAAYMKIAIDSVDVLCLTSNIIIEIWFIPDSGSDITMDASAISGIGYNSQSLAEYSTISTYTVPSNAVLIDSFHVIRDNKENLKIRTSSDVRTNLFASVFKDFEDKTAASCYLITAKGAGAATVYFKVNWTESY